MNLFRKYLPHPWLSVFLFFVWQLIVNDLSPGTLLAGILLALCIPLLTRRFRPSPPVLHHPGLLIRLSARVMGDILIANLEVARLILGRNSRLQPAFVEYPLDLQNEFAIHILSSIISLTPGTVTADLAADRKTLLIHGLHVPDEAFLIGNIKIRYERPLKEVFECSNTPS